MDKSVRLFYLRDEHKFPLACVATKPDGEFIQFAISIRNLKDVFSRERGREIATQRLLKMKPKHVGYVLKEPGAKKHILKQISGNSDLPARIRQAATATLTRAEAK